MFENIIGQDSVINLLKSDITNNTYSNSIIFYGPSYSGKLTSALEFTRIINCKNDGSSTCTCDSCRRINALTFEGLLFLSRRNFYYTLFEYISLYKNQKDGFSFNMIGKIIKLIAMPLQNFLTKGVSNESEINKVIKNSEKINDIIVKNEYTSVDLEELLKYAIRVSSLYKTKNIPIQVMRNMLDWTYIAHPDIKKVVVIDSVDFLEESSRNILLKRVEEPSDNLFFILLAENKNKIIATILSRCRTYFFRPLQSNIVTTILGKTFNEDVRYKSLSAFFERSSEIADDKIELLATKLLQLTFLKEHSFSELNLFIQGFSKIKLKNVTEKEFTKALLINLNKILEKHFHQIHRQDTSHSPLLFLNNFPYSFLMNLKELINDYYYKLNVFSLSPLLLLEGIFYPLKSMVLDD